jgi:hypothetical protein
VLAPTRDEKRDLERKLQKHLAVMARIKQMVEMLEINTNNLITELDASGWTHTANNW